MGTTSDKLTYLNGTKQALKESINNIGGSITDETTFRAYATELDNIYSSLPKTTGEGSNLSLTTLKGRINVDDILGDTTQEGTPTPDSPQDIEVVTGQQEVLVRNKNLFNGTLYNGQIGSNGGWTTNANRITNISGSGIASTFELKEGTYTINAENLNQCTLLTQDSNNNIIDNFATSWNNLPFTFTLTQTGLVKFTMRKSDNSNLTPSDYFVQIEKGSTATTYVPYQEQTKTLHLGDIELGGINNYKNRIFRAVEGNSVYDGLSNEIKATLTIDKWYIEKNIGKIVLNGSESWEQQWASPNYSYRTAISDIEMSTSATTIPNLYSNRYTAYAFNTLYSGANYGITLRTNYQQLVIKNTDITSANDFKTWLSTHNTEVRYVLSTPTYEEITNTTLLEELNELEKMYSYSGQTNINISGNLPMILSVSALKGE